jgi:hypothetical protein
VTDLPPARILECTPEEYFKLPGFSPSLSNVLLSRCPAVARDQYERNLVAPPVEDDAEDESSETVKHDKQKRLDRGTVLHAMTLGKGEQRIAVIPDSMLSGKNRSISSDKAKAWRDAAMAEGKVVVKELDHEKLGRVVDALRDRLAAAGHVLDGTSEFAIEWWEPSPHGPVQCRTMIDHVSLVFSGDPDRPTAAFAFELKFPGDAAPDRSERTSDGLGYHIACAARHRALNALYPSIAGRIEYRYLFCEPHRPYAFWDPTPTGAYLELGDRQWRSAVNQWAAGLNTGQWPGYHQDNGRRNIDLLRWRKMQEGFPYDE